MDAAHDALPCQAPSMLCVMRCFTMRVSVWLAQATSVKPSAPHELKLKGLKVLKALPPQDTILPRRQPHKID